MIWNKNKECMSRDEMTRLHLYTRLTNFFNKELK